MLKKLFAIEVKSGLSVTGIAWAEEPGSAE